MEGEEEGGRMGENRGGRVYGEGKVGRREEEGGRREEGGGRREERAKKKKGEKGLYNLFRKFNTFF